MSAPFTPREEDIPRGWPAEARANARPDGDRARYLLAQGDRGRARQLAEQSVTAAAAGDEVTATYAMRAAGVFVDIAAAEQPTRTPCDDEPQDAPRAGSVR